ncbi:hypothetical protein HN51_013710 [Arachis hypogaea]|uniref:non-specific serine/threonine protein kinase n=2 Tax=Arachis hypogaea TaxID=3818 RepID=A0A445DP18_ARAHY|nr:probable LRR receptor-like serine/threonine-protein kinase At1g14390 [Arachis ipaensis]XP_025639012.1 probable LRR receptor-like serine/threonine-protein kinase At1g14390 [Arachis hypogaea]QHO59504.1 putative LRR receptor-like serine/threonine-protein kinase [Arachis hypogaea]RYR64917.1 hypothetical protein Ahy_A03g010937 isoform A [Arachis hypogaea]
MKRSLVLFCNLFPSTILLVLLTITTSTSAQLVSSENRILFQVQKLLEYPQALQGWNNWTNFCYLPPSPSLTIVCTNGHVTELTIIGNNTSSHQILSSRFSIDSLFTVMTKFSNLKALSLVSLGLWGPLPSKINRFWSLEVLNISSNFIYGEIPPSISTLKSLKSLVLADNLFNGTVPDFKKLTFLQELNLGGNKLGPYFPSLLGQNLVSLILRNNSLRSQIPLQLIKFDKLQTLDISSNVIFGKIPSFLFSLRSLQYLNLAANQLSGNLSAKTACGSALTFVDISHNLLVGKLPSCIGSMISTGKVLYSGNCFSTRRLNDQQHPYSFCKKEVALAVKPPEKTKKENESRVKLSLLLGIIGGAVGIAAILVLLTVFIVRKSNQERSYRHRDRSVADKFYARASPGPNTDTRRVPQTMRLSAVGMPPYCNFTSEEIEDATNNFDSTNLIGEGTQGQLYRGWLRDGAVVLVNCVKIKQKGLPHTINQNLEVLPNLRHRHLMSVLGHCVITHQENPQPTSTVFIVFEHISNVSLRDQLTDWRKRDMLKWPQRMAISIGIARGVQFLHTGVAPGIFGNNLKVENILLDDSLNAKVSRYSIPLPSKNTDQNASNQIGSTNNAEKEDIYQLGVILLEVITGKQIKSSSEIEELKDELEKGSSEAQSVLRSAVDPCLRGTYAYESMRTAVQITINCLSKAASQRPSIEDVLWNLQYSMQVQESWTSSGNLSTKF